MVLFPVPYQLRNFQDWYAPCHYVQFGTGSGLCSFCLESEERCGFNGSESRFSAVALLGTLSGVPARGLRSICVSYVRSVTLRCSYCLSSVVVLPVGLGLPDAVRLCEVPAFVLNPGLGKGPLSLSCALRSRAKLP